MKHLRTLVGLLLIGLLVKNGLADISLTLRNGRGRGGQAYLPPTAQNAPRSEEYVRIRDGSSGAQQQNFEESNYGNSRYQIFEVHNHYGPSSGGASQHTQAPQGNNDATHSSYESQGYLPPHQEIHIQHVNDAPGAIDDNLDVSYLSFAAAEGLDGHQITIAEQAPSAPTTTDVSVPVPFPSNFQHNIPKSNRIPAVTTQEIHVEHHDAPPQQSKVRAQDARQTNYRASDYLPPHESSPAAPAAPEYRAPDYLPPHREEHVSLQHQHYQEQQHKQQHHVASAVQHQQQQRPKPVSVGAARYKGPDYLPPPKTPTHETAVNEQNFISQSSQAHTTTASQENREFHAPEYLPPSHTAHQQQPHIEVQQPTYQQHQGVQPTQRQQAQHHQSAQVHHVVQSSYKGPDYLPPHNGIANHPQQQQHVAHTSYKGPDYLPPHSQAEQPQNHHQQHNNVATTQGNVGSVHNVFKGPDYLPPQHSSVATHKTRYSEPHTEVVINAAAPTALVSEYRAPGYLPPGYDFVNPEEKAPEVPAYQEQNVYQQHQQHAVHQAVLQHVSVAQSQSATPVVQSSYGAPGILPSGYEINKPEGAKQAIAQLHSQGQQQQPRQSQSVQQYQQQAHVNQATVQQQQHQEVVVQSHIQVAGREQGSDIVYGRQKENQQPQQPERQNIAEVQHSSFQASGYLPPAPAAPAVQQPLHHYQAQHEQVQTLTTGVQQHQTQHTHQHGHQQPQLQQPQLQQPQLQQPQQQQPQLQQPQLHQPQLQRNYAQQVAPQFFPTEEPVQQFSAPTVRPVALGVAPPSYMHTLSSYMTSVQPFERYGTAQFTEPRRPFAEYGPPRPSANSAPFRPSQPLAHQQQPQQQQTFEVAPMYREQATRPQYYAPSMSYTGYSASSSSLSAQAKQSLQKFMPREIQQQIVAAAAAPLAPATSGKIRTVQIVNPTAVKTLKVLETSDHAGVKTIKILGTSNEDPMGEHRIVKVVSQNGHNGQEGHVQTVKIFNDHKDVVIPAAAPAAQPTAIVAVGAQSYDQQHNSNNQNRNAYLPPAPRKQRSAQQQKRKQRPIIAGKDRRRH